MEKMDRTNRIIITIWKEKTQQHKLQTPTEPQNGLWSVIFFIFVCRIYAYFADVIIISIIIYLLFYCKFYLLT